MIDFLSLGDDDDDSGDDDDDAQIARMLKEMGSTCIRRT
jgi:hypothetical protein